jgi:hypothetical protein
MTKEEELLDRVLYCVFHSFQLPTQLTTAESSQGTATSSQGATTRVKTVRGPDRRKENFVKDRRGYKERRNPERRIEDRRKFIGLRRYTSGFTNEVQEVSSLNRRGRISGRRVLPEIPRQYCHNLGRTKDRRKTPHIYGE